MIHSQFARLFSVACVFAVPACVRHEPPQAKFAEAPGLASTEKQSPPIAASTSAVVESGPASAANDPPTRVEERSVYLWQGLLGKDATFKMYLEREGDALRGIYVMNDRDGVVDVKGSVKKNDHFTLTEVLYKVKKPGTFDGTLVNGMLKGTYTGPASKKPLAVTTEPLQSELPETFSEAYRGVLGSRLRIRAKLERHGATLTGAYRYARSKNDLKLVGAVKNSAEFVLRESTPDGKETGVFTGVALASHVFVGRWSNADKSKSLPFVLEMSLEYPEIVELGNGVRVVPVESYSEPSKVCTAAFTYPTFEGAKGAKALNATFKHAPKLTQSDCEGAGEEIPYSFEESYTIVKGKAPYVGVSTDYYEYAGGAHSNSWQTCRLANLDTGEVTSIAKQMTPENLKKLSDIVSAALRKKHNKEKLSDAGFHDDSIKLTADSKVCLASHGGVEVVFDPYEVAPYAMGSETVPIALEDARKVLSGDGRKALNP
jgi:hypothetical protein